jgi:YVTN family beta-propeller protein
MPMTSQLSLRMTAAVALSLLAFGAAAQNEQDENSNNSAIRLPNGTAITPTAAAGSRFQLLNPGLPSRPGFVAGQPVSTAISPDAKTLLVVTSGYNLNDLPNGNAIPSESNEYVFVFDISGGRPIQKQVLTIPNTFMGLAWNPSGNEFYVSGGVNDSVIVFTRSGANWQQAATIPLGHAQGIGLLSNAPAPFNAFAPTPEAAGIALDSTGRLLIVANLFNDSVSLISVATRTKVAELDLRPGALDPAKKGVPGGTYPFWVAIKGSAKAYVSSVRDREIVVVNLLGAQPTIAKRIPVQGQPNRMILNQSESRLFVALDNSDSVAIVNTDTDVAVESFSTLAPDSVYPPGLRHLRGANPNSLALSRDEQTLYVTNGGTNSVAVIDLSPRSGLRVTGLIPAGWYPHSVSVSRDGSWLYVVNGKTLPGPNPLAQNPHGGTDQNQYVLQLQKGGLLSMPTPNGNSLRDLTEQVANNNHFPGHDESDSESESVIARLRGRIQHVIYIVKENRTYDQVLGDLEKGNGDPRLAQFPKPISPNHHQLAGQFVTLDNYYDSGEVSGVGWNWSTAGRTTDYAEKTQPVNYAGRGLNYDWEGTNRGVNVGFGNLAQRIQANPATQLDPSKPADDILAGAADVSAPDGAGGEAGAGYIWDEALHAGLSVRNYGFYIDLFRYSVPANNPLFIPPVNDPFAQGIVQSYPTKASLRPVTDVYFRGYDNKYPDFYRFKEFEREFDGFVANKNLPNLMLVRLMHDHFGSFGSAQSGVNTPDLQMADNDYAVGLLIEKLSKSPYKGNTLVFITEDDSQDGPDHVDAHRSTGFVIGPYVKQGAVVSDYFTTVSMVRTIESVLGLSSNSIFTGLTQPMSSVFDLSKPDWNYTAIVPEILRGSQLPLPARTAQNGGAAFPKWASRFSKPTHPASYWERKLGDQHYEVEDQLDTNHFNRELWKGLMGSRPYPTKRDGRDLRANRESLLDRKD